MRRYAAALAAALLLTPLALGAGACTQQADTLAAPPRGDEATLALVALAVDFHKKADLALAAGRPQDARAELGALLDLCDRYNVRTPEGLDVRFDAATRLARLHMEADQLPEAEAAARRGLDGAEDAPPTLFRGYLLQTLADLRERQGDPRGAVDLHTQAIEVFKGVLESGRGGLSPRKEGTTP